MWHAPCPGDVAFTADSVNKASACGKPKVACRGGPFDIDPVIRGSTEKVPAPSPRQGHDQTAAAGARLCLKDSTFLPAYGKWQLV